MGKNKILIFGAGVIGSAYAAMLSTKDENDIKVFARGRRLEQLKKEGLRYFDEKTKTIKKAKITVLENLPDNMTFDFAFVTIRYEQVIDALEQVKNNATQNIVVMVNNPLGYAKWQEILKERLIVGFPNIGGKIEDGVLYFKHTPAIIQRTTLGEVNGRKTDRIKKLKRILKNGGFKTAVSNNMDAWQKTHLAIVIPAADGIYMDGGDAYTTAKNKKALYFMASELKANFRLLKAKKIPVKPFRLRIIRICPKWLIKILLKKLFRTKLAETVISYHTLNARKEAEMLKEDFYKAVKS